MNKRNLNHTDDVISLNVEIIIQSSTHGWVNLLGILVEL